MSPFVFDDIVGSFYEAAAGQQRWQAALGRLVDAVDAKGVHLIGIDRRVRELEFAHSAGRGAAQWMIDYLGYWHRHNPRWGLATTTATGEWMHCHEHFDEAFVRASPFYQQFLIPHGARYTSTTKILDDERHRLLLVITRDARTGPLGAGEVRVLERLRHHLARAYALADPPDGPDRAMQIGHRMVEELGHPTWVVGRSRQVMFRNRAAAQVIQDGGPMRESGGCLTAAMPEDDARLRRTLRRLLQTAPAFVSGPQTRVVRLSTQGGEPPQPLFVTLLPADPLVYDWGDAPALMLVLHDRDEIALPDPAVVARVFELTPAESRIAVSLAAGMTVERIARQSAITIATVRSHVKSLFMKTGASRQADVVRLLAALPHAALTPPSAPVCDR